MIVFGILYLQSSYSMLHNAIPLKTLVQQAKAGGYDFIALSDPNLHAMISLFKLAHEAQIKPVLGMHLKLTIDLLESGFLVYVKNQEGYQNLLKLNLKSQEKALELSDLKAHQKGLIFVTSGADSILTKYVLEDNMDLAKYHANQFKESLSDVYFGLSLDTFDLEMKVAPKLYQLSEHVKIKMLPIHQTSYLNKEDQEVYEALLKIEDEKNEVPKDANYAFLNQNELKALFADYPFIFDSLSKVIQEISYTFEKPHFDMPIFPIPQGTPEAYLKSLSTLGLKKRLSKQKNPDHKLYQTRLLYELSVIHQMGFDNYFLIVYDFVRYAKTHDILVGPGRGSSAGSLVAYCLGITDVDPIQYDLLFERFLNPERLSMPDIDMDFPDNKRDEVLQYVREKYGDFHMVSIVTFGTFALRSSIRDIARVMKIDPQRVTGIIQSVISEKIDETDQEMMRLLRVAKAIEGLPRHTGTHAAGMILAHQDLSLHIPLQKGLYQFYQSQLEASDLESLGLLKMDFLGIRNLAVIDDVLKEIKRTIKPLSIYDIPFDDALTYELLCQAETSGIFQLESSGMRAVLRKLKPNTFEDIVAILALYRPGPMDNIDEYISRRNGKSYDMIHPNLSPILSKTYGIIVYQEQIMRIASEFAGYTLAEADLLRRGISKKDKNILEEERKRFTQKCHAKGYTKDLAEQIYDYIVKFADYGFNRSHSVAYAMVAYQMAYLKANYFSIFMTILLSSVTGNEGLTSDYLNEVRRRNIKILPPDINLSTDHYVTIEGKIYLPLLAIKSIGRLTVTKIMEERQTHGLYQDFLSLKLRLKKEINEKNLEMLIHSGALDQLGMNHQTMMNSIKMSDAGYEQYITDYQVKTYEEFNFSELVAYEKEALGFNITYHPLQVYQALIQKHQLKTLFDFETIHEGIVLAYIKKMKKIKTKQGKPMAFLLLDDGASELEVTLFSESFLKYESMLSDQVMMFKIRANTFNDKKTFVLEAIKTIA
jgi:DNA polymerase III subunit alpha